ncbi:MAG: hypothetical protein EBR81_05265 [Proteobacteria bacterium]|nr:hypothetical protein [Pseudomonadota bacterium]
MSSPDARDIVVEQTILPLEQSAIASQKPKPEQICLDQAIRDNVDRLGHTGSHTLGIFVQLLTTGKVKFSFRSHVKRLEILDKSRILSRSQALVTVESLLAELRDEDAPTDLPEFTQNIIIQAPKASLHHQ